MNLFRTKPIAELQAEATAEHDYKHTLNPISLINLNIGSMIGANIFVLTNTSTAQYTDPTIALSFIFTNISYLFANLYYAELTSMIPISNNTYTYNYATLGEFLTWIVDWYLMLEYLFSGEEVGDVGEDEG
jgi:Amino acid transporters